jgi:S1-C subfamily serine protease
MKIRMFFILVVALGIFCASTTEGQALREVFKRVNSSVVVIRTIETDVVAEPPIRLATASSLGSGVLISTDGAIMTAAHLVETADTVFVEFSNGEIFTAKVIGSEPAADVALLKLNSPQPSGATVARLGDSDKVEVGDQIFVVGAPHGISYTLTVGYISARRRPNVVYSGLSLAEFFQTDAAINEGNSGGPMFNMAGEIVGIVSSIISKSGGSEGLGFVATSNMARQLLLQRRSFWGGLAGYFITRESAKVLNVPPPGEGMLVQRVARNSPAALMGLRGGTMKATLGGENVVLGGDIVLTVQGIPFSIKNYEKIRDVVSRLETGDLIKVKILRAGELLDLNATKIP